MEEMNKKPSLFSRIGHFFRSYKSETKKIVWCPWKQVRKNSMVVLVIVVACAAVICALDFGFSWSLKGLRETVNPSATLPETVVSDTVTEDTTEDATEDTTEATDSETETSDEE